MLCAMIGMDRTTGKQISDTAHLTQSIADILTTPLGSRVMRRDYGSALFELIDQPINGVLRMLVHSATVIAINQWEPRFKVTRVLLGQPGADGSLAITVEGNRTDLPQPNARVSLLIPLRGGSAAAAAPQLN